MGQYQFDHLRSANLHCDDDRLLVEVNCLKEDDKDRQAPLMDDPEEYLNSGTEGPRKEIDFAVGVEVEDVDFGL